MASAQNYMILEHLKNKGPITPMEALIQYKCMRLGARIYDLKQLGFDIRSRYISHTNADGEVKRYKQYWLRKEQS